jgi:hypothetical protein
MRRWLLGSTSAGLHHGPVLLARVWLPTGGVSRSIVGVACSYSRNYHCCMVKRGDIIGLIRNNDTTAEGRKLKRVKAGPIELEWTWEKLVAEAADQVERAALPTRAPSEDTGAPAPAGPGGRPEPTSPVSGAGIPPEAIRPISSSVPTAVVLEEFARIESRLRDLLRRAGATVSERETVGTLGQRAFQMGLISKELFAAINSLAKLRNEAAHRVGTADITTDQARQYLDLAERVLMGLGVSTGMSQDGSAGTYPPSR